jgi:Ca-activated chloride channel family protein
LLEAKKVLVKEMSGTLFTLARDVKIQVEFNPALVGAYRLIGYENRALADEDFKNDSKDAGEIGVGHSVTALYELIPAGHRNVPDVDQLKYRTVEPSLSPSRNELLTVKLRYKPQGKESSEQISLSVEKNNNSLENTSDDFRFAAAVAGYGMLLQQSPYLGSFSWDICLKMVQHARGLDTEGYRAEFYKIVEMSQLLSENG